MNDRVAAECARLDLVHQPQELLALIRGQVRSRAPFLLGHEAGKPRALVGLEQAQVMAHEKGELGDGKDAEPEHALRLARGRGRTGRRRP